MIKDYLSKTVITDCLILLIPPIKNGMSTIRQLELVTVASFADLKCITGKTYADSLVLDRLIRHLLAQRWLHHFFAMAS